MTDLKKWSLILACAVLAGCAGAQRREANTASQKTASADAAVKAAKQVGAPSCASKELKAAETDLQFARSNIQKKEYSLAARFADTAKTSADAAVTKCAEAKKKSKKK